MAGAPLGNQNAKQGTEFRSAIKRALSRYSNDSWRAGLDKVADEYVRAAANGDSWAIRDMADRLDGKPAQSLDIDIDAQVGMREIIKEYVSTAE